MHAATAGLPFINPDHKVEYKPAELRQMLVDTGFRLILEKGVCEMPETTRSESFPTRTSFSAAQSLIARNLPIFNITNA
jgi:hypothetical protein